MYNEMFEYVKKLLEENNALHTKFCFRNRFTHIKRVYRWAKILLEDYPNCNQEVVLISAIFHDVGYAYGKVNHALNSAKIFIEYAEDKDFNEDLKRTISNNISLHSNKELLNDPNTPIELILLLEADLLDEEGALGIVWDLLAEGGRMPDSYDLGLKSIFEHSAHIFKQDFMVTKKAREIWEKKKSLVRNFVSELENDLFLN